MINGAQELGGNVQIRRGSVSDNLTRMSVSRVVEILVFEKTKLFLFFLLHVFKNFLKFCFNFHVGSNKNC